MKKQDILSSLAVILFLVGLISMIYWNFAFRGKEFAGFEFLVGGLVLVGVSFLFLLITAILKGIKDRKSLTTALNELE